MQIQKPRQGYKLVKSLFGKYEEIPKEWNEVRQGKVCQFINGYAYSQSEFREKGYPIIRIQNLTGGNNFVYSDVELPEKQFAKDGDLLFAWSATFGPFIWHGPKAAFHYHQWNVIPNENTDKKFLYYHLIRISSTVKQMGQSGLGMFHMTKNGMERMPMFLPPLNQQQKIASILSNVDSLIQHTQKEIEQTQRLKKGLMQRLLTRGIGHTRFKKTKLGEIPEDWKIEKGNDICSEIIVGIVIKPASLYSKIGVPCLRSFNIKEDYINEKDIVLISSKSNESNSKSKLKKNDVLIVRTGYPGTSCVVTSKFEGGNCIDLVIARPKKELNSYFLSKFINSHVGKGQVLRTQGGLAQQHFNVGEMRNMLIPIPTLSEQQKIISILYDIDSQIQKQQEYKSKLENLKKGLMQKLLTGQIRVKV